MDQFTTKSRRHEEDKAIDSVGSLVQITAKTRRREEQNTNPFLFSSRLRAFAVDPS